MTASTATCRVSNPPTEDDIRALVEANLRNDGSLNVAGRLSDTLNDAIRFLDDVYDFEDMRPSEVAALDAALSGALDPIRDRMLADMRTALASAMVTFAATHPDAPRSKPEAVPA